MWTLVALELPEAASVASVKPAKLKSVVKVWGAAGGGFAVREDVDTLYSEQRNKILHRALRLQPAQLKIRISL